MIVTAWNNGSSGYGVKISYRDRKKYFREEWESITLEIEGFTKPIDVNVNKSSFWTPKCGELIKKEIRYWLFENDLAPWPYRKPPKLWLEFISDRSFSLSKYPPPSAS